MAKSAKKTNHDATIIAQAVADALKGDAMPNQSISALGEIDLTAHPLPQDFGTFAGVKKVITTIPARKPNNQAYFRVHPDEAWQQAAFVLQLKEDSEFYYVLPALCYELAQEARAKMLYTYITRDGNVGVWPINMPGDDGRLDNWSQSAHTAATMAQGQWVRLVANRTVGAYDVMTASLADAPIWPDLSFKEILNLAFKGRIISSLDHPIVKRLRGEI